MKLPDHSHPDWVDARLEAFLDGVLPPDEHAAVAQALADDDAWEDELLLARRIQEELRAWPEPACPPHVTAAVLDHARRAARGAWRDGLGAWILTQWTGLRQPALAMTVLLLVVLSAALLGRSPEPAPSRAEVEQALADVQWTLAYLSEVGRETGRAVRHDVLTDRVVSPVQNALHGRRSQPQEPQTR